MSDCCCSTAKAGPAPAKINCPLCGEAASPVSVRTLLHQLREPWAQLPLAGTFFFCGRPHCAAVYFDAAGRLFNVEALRGPVGQKGRGDDDPLCYCFGISYAMARGDSALRDFVVDQTRDGQCECEVRNPSGRCCLVDFPRP